MPKQPASYIAVKSAAPVYHVLFKQLEGKPEVVCREVIPNNVELLTAPATNPALFHQAQQVCGKCEPAPPVEVEVQDLMARASTRYRAYLRNRREAVSAYLAGGQALTEAKALVEHGAWIPLLGEFGIPDRTASRMMRLAERFGDDAGALIEAGGIRVADEAVSGPAPTEDDETPNQPPVADLGPEVQEAPPLASREEMEDDLDDLESENLELRSEVQRRRDPGVLPTQTGPSFVPDPMQQMRARIAALQTENDRLKSERDTHQKEMQALADDIEQWATVGWQRAAEAKGWTPPSGWRCS